MTVGADTDTVLQFFMQTIHIPLADQPAYVSLLGSDVMGVEATLLSLTTEFAPVTAPAIDHLLRRLPERL